MALFWPPSVKWVDELDAVGPAASKMWLDHTRAWGNNRSLARFWMEHYDDEWARVRECRVEWEWYAGRGKGEKYRIERDACANRPYCPACNNQWQNERAHKALKALRRATPGGKAPRAFMVTIAPRKRSARRDEWQDVAAEHHRAYLRACFLTLRDSYGEGIGAFAIYQHYGEKPFLVAHPHVHLLVNGWKLEDDQPKPTPYYDMQQGGGERIRQRLVEHVAREVKHGIQLDGIDLVNVRIDQVETEAGRLRRLFRYNYRELIDPTKWKYPRGADHVRVENYHDPHDTAEVPVGVLRDGLAWYGRRFGKWGEPGTRPTDARFGILADSQIRETERAMGADVEHADDCVCRRCMEWSGAHEGPEDATPLRFEQEEQRASDGGLRGRGH